MSTDKQVQWTQTIDIKALYLTKNEDYQGPHSLHLYYGILTIGFPHAMLIFHLNRSFKKVQLLVAYERNLNEFVTKEVHW